MLLQTQGQNPFAADFGISSLRADSERHTLVNKNVKLLAVCFVTNVVQQIAGV